jgi:hypothetical protein
MMWQPNLVFTIGETSPLFNAKAAFSNSFTIFPRVKVPRSPPRFPEGQSETTWAIALNFSPFFKRSNTALASLSDLTRIWAQCTLSGMAMSIHVSINNSYLDRNQWQTIEGPIFCMQKARSKVTISFINIFNLRKCH